MDVTFVWSGLFFSELAPKQSAKQALLGYPIVCHVAQFQEQ